ncbi:MAG: transposase [Candidatus Doudnabacteria bacterium]|nr:transposase [Candidatus Doudnabacteria bacterium]
MKHRDYKQFSQGCYAHVFNRGNAKLDIFYDDEDYRYFLYRLKEQLHGRLMPASGSGRYVRQLLPPHSFTLLAYCLMPNHFHLIIRQDVSIPVSRLVHRVCTSYSKYFNKKYNRIGHVFQDQFKSVEVTSDEQLWWLSAYVHTNPVVGALVQKPEEYTWSSYQDYAGMRFGILCDTGIVLSRFRTFFDYEKFVHASAGFIRSRKELKDLLLDAG